MLDKALYVLLALILIIACVIVSMSDTHVNEALTIPREDPGMLVWMQLYKRKPTNQELFSIKTDLNTLSEKDFREKHDKEAGYEYIAKQLRNTVSVEYLDKDPQHSFISLVYHRFALPYMAQSNLRHMGQSDLEIVKEVALRKEAADKSDEVDCSDGFASSNGVPPKPDRFYQPKSYVAIIGKTLPREADKVVHIQPGLGGNGKKAIGEGFEETVKSLPPPTTHFDNCLIIGSADGATISNVRSSYSSRAFTASPCLDNAPKMVSPLKSAEGYHHPPNTEDKAIAEAINDTLGTTRLNPTIITDALNEVEIENVVMRGGAEATADQSVRYKDTAYEFAVPNGEIGDIPLEKYASFWDRLVQMVLKPIAEPVIERNMADILKTVTVPTVKPVKNDDIRSLPHTLSPVDITPAMSVYRKVGDIQRNRELSRLALACSLASSS